MAVAGILALIGRKLPEAGKAVREEKELPPESAQKRHILSLQLPSRLRTWFKFWLQRVWHWLLEAKDIRKPAAVGYRIKKMLPKKKVRAVVPLALENTEVKDEQYYLQVIRDNPKDLEGYNALGKFYTEAKRFADSRDIYTYLVKRDPGNAGLYARLAFACFKLELYTEAVSNYEKSLALDSAQPNRYYNLSLALDALGKKEEAVMPIKKALELEPQNRKYLDLLSTLTAKTEHVKRKI